MKIQSQTIDVFFRHNIFSWLERGFRTVITWLLCGQSSRLSYGAWETGTIGQVTLFRNFRLPSHLWHYSVLGMDSFFLRFYLFIFRGEGREEGGNIEVWEINQSVASHTAPTGDLACNPGMCPAWESNWWPFRSQAGSPSTEPHQRGLGINSYLALLVQWATDRLARESWCV